MRAYLQTDGTAFQVANPGRFTCPICSTLQSTPATFIDLGAIRISVRQCMHCAEITVTGSLYSRAQTKPFHDKSVRLYPDRDARAPKTYKYCNRDVEAAYREACELFHVHAGASGAYARRALELILDIKGYKAKTLAGAIELASAETDTAKVLPKRLLINLDYVKEIGNFSLHIRRDDELGIIAVETDELNACLEIIEELIDEVFEKPAEDIARLVALNEKLQAAGKKRIALPEPAVALPDFSETTCK